MGGNERIVEGFKREWEGMRGWWKDLIRMGGGGMRGLWKD